MNWNELRPATGIGTSYMNWDPLHELGPATRIGTRAGCGSARRAREGREEDAKKTRGHTAYQTFHGRHEGTK